VTGFPSGEVRNIGKTVRACGNSMCLTRSHVLKDVFCEAGVSLITELEVEEDEEEDST